MDEPHSFLSIIFSQDPAHLLHDTIAVGLVDLIWNSMIVALGIHIYKLTKHWLALRYGKDDEHMSFSLNYVKDGHFHLRTMGGAGISINRLYENLFVRSAFYKAGKKTTRWSVVLKFPRRLRTEIYSILVGHVTDDSSHGYYRASAGLPTRTEKYVIMPTKEKYGLMRIRKTRGIITPLELLQNLPMAADLKFQRERHRDRIDTLQEIWEIYSNLTDEEKLDCTYDVEFEP